MNIKGECYDESRKQLVKQRMPIEIPFDGDDNIEDKLDEILQPINRKRADQSQTF